MVVSTFAAWFEAQAGRGDQIGHAARAWKDAKGARPKVSGVEGVTRWVLADPGKVPMVPEAELEPAMVAAASEYRGGAQQAASVPITGRPVAPVTPLQPVQAADQGEQQAGQDAELAEWSPAIMTALDRLEAWALRFEQGMQQVIAWQHSWEQQMGPLNRLLIQLAEAEQAEAEADQLADRAAADGLISDQLAGEYRQATQGADSQPVDWALIHPVHCRDDRCNSGATCGCPCHQLAAGQQRAAALADQAFSFQHPGQLPDGLAQDPVTGVISGVPQQVSQQSGHYAGPVAGRAFYRGAVPEPAWDALAHAAQVPEDEPDGQ